MFLLKFKYNSTCDCSNCTITRDNIKNEIINTVLNDITQLKYENENIDGGYNSNSNDKNSYSNSSNSPISNHSDLNIIKNNSDLSDSKNENDEPSHLVMIQKNIYFQLNHKIIFFINYFSTANFVCATIAKKQENKSKKI